MFDISQSTYKDALPLEFSTFYSEGYNNVRRRSAIIISDTLNKHKEFKKLKYQNQMDILIKIEVGCENETIRKTREQNLRCEWSNPHFNNIYYSVCYNVISLLSDEDDSIIVKLVNGIIGPGTVARLTYKDLNINKISAIMARIDKRANIEWTVKCTELYFCEKCNNNKTDIERVQNRSGDEGSTFIITCLFCGARWSK
jgi:DNA-directed RNA polymerase subunit M/transcription elongation factor TFIIS